MKRPENNEKKSRKLRNEKRRKRKNFELNNRRKEKQRQVVKVSRFIET